MICLLYFVEVEKQVTDNDARINTNAANITSNTDGVNTNSANITANTGAIAAKGDGNSLDSADGSRPDALILDNNGNVGIGTSTPAGNLDVQGTLTTPLTGDVIVGNGLTAVVGSSDSLFTQELAVGDTIKIGTEVFTVTAITDDQNLDIDSAHSTGVFSIKAFKDSDLFVVRDGAGNAKLTVDQSGYVLIPDRPAFSTSLTSHWTTPGEILFDLIGVNNGNHYDPTTGRFTAPIGGLYQFCFGGIEQPLSATALADIQVNGSNTPGNRVYSSAGVSYDGSYKCIIVNLNIGDYVSVNNISASGVGWYRSPHALFTGHLL